MKNQFGRAIVVVALFTGVVVGDAAVRDGGVDPTFDPGSTVNGYVRAVAVQTNGQVVIGGDFTTVHGAVRGHVARLNTNGTTDLSFMAGLAGADDTVRTIAIQGDGKMVVGGCFFQVNGVARHGLARLNADGSLDASFQDPAVQFHDYHEGIFSVLVQPDGKVLIGGTFFAINGTARTNIARLNADGSLDAGFQDKMGGANGVGNGQGVTSLALQSDGKIFIGGVFTGVNGVEFNRSGLARLNPDGSLDGSFPNVINSLYGIYGLALRPDGKLLVMGVVNASNGPALLNSNGVVDGSFNGQQLGWPFALGTDGKISMATARLNADGSVDTGFQVASNSSPGIVNCVAVQPDGKVLVGTASLTRLNTNGAVDAGFAGGGRSGLNDEVNQVLVQPDGKILISGAFSSIDGVSEGGVARLNADGSLDQGFKSQVGGFQNVTLAMQPDGKVLAGGGSYGLSRLKTSGSVDPTFASPTINGSLLSFALQTDGKVVLGGGVFYQVNGELRTSIARLNANGSLDTNFQNGMDGIGSGGSGGTVFSLAIQTDGKVIVGGFFDSVNGVGRSGIARLNTDGSIDDTFQNGMAGVNGDVESIAVQADGKVVIGGDFTAVNGVPRYNLARLNADGGLDTDFEGEVTFAPNVTIQADGKILLAGNFESINGQPCDNLARLKADGTLDADLTGDFGGLQASVLSVAVQPDGRLVLGGYFQHIDGVLRPFIARIYGTIPRLTDGGSVSNHYGCKITGYPGQNMVVEASTNLVNWISLVTNKLVVSPQGFSDTRPADLGNRFYRVRLQ